MSGFIPEGSYTGSSENFSVTLNCEAKNNDQKWIPASYPISDLKEPNAGLVNWDGCLESEKGNYPQQGFVPQGSYKDTCQHIRIILSAKCKDLHENWHHATLDITNYDYTQGDIANINGDLKVIPEKLVNAWILMDEDEPAGTNYNSSNSCYQRLIKENIYQSVDILFICFATTIQTGSKTIPSGDGSSYTLEICPATHPGGLTNQDYMNYVIRDARKNNPNIKIAVTLNYDPGEIFSRIFPNPKRPDQQSADKFAANLMAYLKHYDLDGFDMDWEGPLSDDTTQKQFELIINAIGKQFEQQSDKDYFLTISPATKKHLDVAAVNNNVDFINFQLYYSTSLPDDFKEIGINSELFAYGAKFEGKVQTAQRAYDNNRDNYHYKVFTVWRLNSTNYEYEQSEQQKLYQLVYSK